MKKYGVSVPCHGCMNRSPCCHSSCEAYGEYRKRIDHYNEIAYKESNTQSCYIENILRTVYRSAKRKRRCGNGDE